MGQLQPAQTFRLTLLAGIAISLVYGQSDSGRIAGAVMDSTMAVVPNAIVNVKNEKTAQTRKVTANDQGVYLVMQLGPSTYTIRAVVAGLAPEEQHGVRLQHGHECT